MLRNSDGTFQSPTYYFVGYDPVAVAIGHFYGDNMPLDIVTANYGGNSISLLQGNGNGTFSQTVNTISLSDPSSDSPIPLYPTAVAAVAVAGGNGDGQDEIVTANEYSPNEYWPSITSLDYGVGGFLPITTSLNDPTGVYYQPTAVVAADFSGDGNTDIVVSEPGNQSIGFFTVNGDGTFSPRSIIPRVEIKPRWLSATSTEPRAPWVWTGSISSGLARRTPRPRSCLTRCAPPLRR